MWRLLSLAVFSFLCFIMQNINCFLFLCCLLISFSKHINFSLELHLVPFLRSNLLIGIWSQICGFGSSVNRLEGYTILVIIIVGTDTPPLFWLCLFHKSIWLLLLLLPLCVSWMSFICMLSVTSFTFLIVFTIRVCHLRIRTWLVYFLRLSYFSIKASSYMRSSICKWFILLLSTLE